MQQIDEMKQIYEMQEGQTMMEQDNLKFIKKVETFEKNHKEDLKKQEALIDEIQKVQEKVLKFKDSNLLEKIQTLRQNSIDESEYQTGVEKNVSESLLS